MNTWLLSFLQQYLPLETLEIGLTLVLSFLVGFEREEHNVNRRLHFFGGARTYPLIGLIGYMMARVSDFQAVAISVGFVVVAGFMYLSYQKKLSSGDSSGITSELSGLFIYLIGVMVFHKDYWIASSLVVIAILLLELKNVLENLAQKIPDEEIFIFAKFLLLTVVILPAVPDAEFTSFELNPFHIWLVVVVISSVSYIIYILDKIIGPKGGVILAAFMGGAYSSTVTTILFARRSQRENLPKLFSGGMLISSGTMYLRLIIFLALFNWSLCVELFPSFTILGVSAIVFGLIWCLQQVHDDGKEPAILVKNPLELKYAILFAGVFLGMSILTRIAQSIWGSSGIYGLAFISGFADVDSLAMSVAHSVGKTTSLGTAAIAILIATMSNNLLKGAYAFAFGKGPARTQGLFFHLGLVALGLILEFMK